MTGTYVFPDGTTPGQRLEALAPRGNRSFTASLHPGVDNVLGLRVPDVRALAREIARGDWRAYLSSPGGLYMEERMLHGMVLGQVKVADVDEYLRLVADFVPEINSWSVCDTFDFAGKNVFARRNAGRVRPWLESYLHDEAEYAVRFGVVMLMKYYLAPDTVDWFLALMGGVIHSGYYVRMAVAWAVSVAMVRDSAAVLCWLRHSPLDAWTHNKAIAKITESYRVAAADKAAARMLRR